MSVDKLEDAKHQISESAFDFLLRSLDEIENSPKYSVIHFATAVELLLKARLMHEHWSLIVTNTSDADLTKFLKGECNTVGQDEAVKRLIGVCSEPISSDMRIQFRKLASHRNRMIHFYHEVESPKVQAEVVKEQCLCWMHLDRLLAGWKDQFEPFSTEILKAQWKMKRNQAYLSAVFETLSAKIAAAKKEGRKFRECSACGYEAAEVAKLTPHFFEQHCLLCGLSDAYIEIQCPDECDATITISTDTDEEHVCGECGYSLSRDELSELLDTEEADEISYVQKNCAHCMSLGSVIQHHDTYICIECLSWSRDIAGCEWCNELQMGGGDLEFSYHSGCEFCDGHAGWHADD
jgi:ribosomal protein S14